jgi:hypothetical protein
MHNVSGDSIGAVLREIVGLISGRWERQLIQASSKLLSSQTQVRCFLNAWRRGRARIRTATMYTIIPLEAFTADTRTSIARCQKPCSSDCLVHPICTLPPYDFSSGTQQPSTNNIHRSTTQSSSHDNDTRITDIPQPGHRWNQRPSHSRLVKLINMGVWDMKFWTYFDARYKKAVWIILFVLIHIAIGLTVPRLFMKGPKTRNTTIALGMVCSTTYCLFSQSADFFPTGRQISNFPRV